MIRTRSAIPAVLALVVAAACADSGEPTGAARPESPAPRQQETLDQDALAQRIPSFAGLYLDEEGAPVVALVGRADADLASREITPALRSRGLESGELRVASARFTYRQLGAWHQAMNESLAEAGVVFTDLDEANNTVTVGVENPVAGMVVRRMAERSGLPGEALQVRIVEPIAFAATVRDQIRPVQGGLQIHFGNYLCTLGFNATSGSTASWITNSHCTNTQGGVEGTQYYQPTSSTPNSFIGTEVADPAYVKGGSCPRGKKCRYSDSSRGAYAAGVTSSLGRVARPASRSSLVGTLTIDAGNPFFTINGEQNSALVGEEVNKVGRTTGWTYGNITNTCVNTGVQGSQVVLFCQHFVAGGVQGGDSGSPVFSWSGSNNITLKGILWGGNSSNNSFVYSPIGQIEQELGALTTS